MPCHEQPGRRFHSVKLNCNLSDTYYSDTKSPSHRKWNNSTILSRMSARHMDVCFLVFTVQSSNGSGLMSCRSPIQGVLPRFKSIHYLNWSERSPSIKLVKPNGCTRQNRYFNGAISTAEVKSRMTWMDEYVMWTSNDGEGRSLFQDATPVPEWSTKKRPHSGQRSLWLSWLLCSWPSSVPPGEREDDSLKQATVAYSPDQSSSHRIPD
jgi:hypothetical protein